MLPKGIYISLHKISCENRLDITRYEPVLFGKTVVCRGIRFRTRSMYIEYQAPYASWIELHSTAWNIRCTDTSLKRSVSWTRPVNVLIFIDLPSIMEYCWWTLHLFPLFPRKFVDLIQEALNSRFVSVKTLQRLIGKCVSFSLAVPAAHLFTREMSVAVSKGMRTLKPIAIQGALRNEIAHWLFLERWDDPLHWCKEKHL